MLHGFLPTFYADVTDVFMGSRRARIVAGISGPLVHLFLGSLYIYLASQCGPGLLKSFLVASAILQSQSLFFSLYPFCFLEMDGYHVLVDWLGLPRLKSESISFVKAHALAAPPRRRAPVARGGGVRGLRGPLHRLHRRLRRPQRLVLRPHRLAARRAQPGGGGPRLLSAAFAADVPPAPRPRCARPCGHVAGAGAGAGEDAAARCTRAGAGHSALPVLPARQSGGGRACAGGGARARPFRPRGGACDGGAGACRDASASRSVARIWARAWPISSTDLLAAGLPGGARHGERPAHAAVRASRWRRRAPSRTARPTSCWARRRTAATTSIGLARPAPRALRRRRLGHRRRARGDAGPRPRARAPRASPAALVRRGHARRTSRGCDAISRARRLRSSMGRRWRTRRWLAALPPSPCPRPEGERE